MLECSKDRIPTQVSPKTIQRYACSLVQLAPFVADKHLDEINSALKSEITRARRKQGVMEATIKRDLVALSSVMNFCVDEGHQEVNTVLPRTKRVKERRDPIMLPRPGTLPR